MSDILLTANNLESEKFANILGRLCFVTAAKTQQYDLINLKAGIVRVDSLNWWGAAIDKATGTWAGFIGRIALSTSEWQTAQQLPFEGGVVAKKVIDQWLKYKNNIVNWINGGTLVIYEQHLQQLHVITDRMGIYPLFTSSVGGIYLSSHPDILAQLLTANGHQLHLDLITMAEFIITSRSVHPYSYYQEIYQLDSGTHYTWDLNRPQQPPRQTEYWHPRYLDEIPTAAEFSEELAEELAPAIRHAVRLRTASHLGKVGVLLSGGADSRAVLFSVEQPQTVDCITLFDETNNELKTAQKLAALAQATHHCFQRDFEYYGRTAQDNVRISGGMSELQHGHLLGVDDEIRNLELGVLLSGCYADYLFKGLAINKKYQTFLGKRLPLWQITRYNEHWYRSYYTLKSDKFNRAVHERIQERLHGIQLDDYLNNALAIEERRIRPLSKVSANMLHAVLRRTQPWDNLFADPAVLEVYGRFPALAKVNRVVFERAVAKIMGTRSKSIADSNYHSKLGVHAKTKVIQWLLARGQQKIRYLLRLEKRYSARTTNGSWPNWNYYLIHSQVLKELWHSPTPLEKEILTTVYGDNPWQTPIAKWAKRHDLLFRLLTLKLWLRTSGVAQ
jgi:asparagine synthase (glutamine-hydrolysing)